MAERSIGVTLLGCGVVGGGVARMLVEQRDELARRTGIRLDLRHVLVRSTDAAKAKADALGAWAAGLPFTTDVGAAIADPAVGIVIELIGGTTLAGALIERALRAGKAVVTANKSLLAERGAEVFALARKHDTCVAFEASCGGGIPIIQALLRDLAGNRIDALLGIVNGTCNFILTKMTQNGWAYDQALKEAQRLGFAEADPVMDVSGRDPAQKLSLLASLAFGARVTERDVHVEGIDRLDAADIRFAGEMGYVIKLLAIAQREPGERVSLRVHPTLVHKSDVLADVSGSFNAISVYGSALGHALWYGRGAGRMPTASAVVADVIGIALGATPAVFRQIRILPDQTQPAAVLPFAELRSRYYLRVMAKDEPGTMAAIATALGKHKVSISAILQHEAEDSKLVPIVITTHLAREGAVATAIREIDELSVTEGPAMCLRIIDNPEEFAGEK
ncbi:MAG: homoserine dehydrogenase [Phycisphaerae bacterium]|nr:homoserine dehydrogenase [Tepidisphaeraceae bacterium]